MCKYCGEEIGCKPTGGMLNSVDALTVDDWAKIYEFEKFVVLPYIHTIILRAEERAGNTFTPGGRRKKMECEK